MEMTDDDLRTVVREFKASVAAEIERLERLIERRAAELGHQLEQRVTEMATAFANSIGDMSARTHARLDAHEREFDAINGRLDGVNGRLDGVDGRLDGVNAGLATIIDRLPPASA